MDLYNNDYQTSKSVSRLFFFFILCHGVYSFTPLLRNLKIFMYMDFVFICIYTIVILFTGNLKLPTSIRKIYNFTLVLLLITSVYKITGISTAPYGTCVRYFSFFITTTIGVLFVNNSSVFQKQALLFVYSTIIVINVLYNMIILHPLVLIGLEPEQYDSLLVNTPNYGGTSFTGFVLLVSLLFSIVMLFGENKYLKFVSLLLLLMCVYYNIYIGMRGTTIFLFIVGFVMIFVLKLLQNSTRIGSVYISIFIFISIIFIFKEEFLYFLIEISPNERIAQRFNDILLISKEGINNDSFTGRGRLLDYSIKSFLSSPKTILFGIGEPDLFIISYEKAGLSGHSDLLDALAKLGLLGTLFIFLCFKHFYIYMSSVYKNTIFKFLFYNIFILVLIYGFVKTIFWENMAVALFVMTPIIFDLLNGDSSRTRYRKQS